MWTNRSVRGFAGDDDPIGAIIRRARKVALDAMDQGWEGPPFDPAALATLLNIEVVPREDIRDARTLPGSGSTLRIEFNPNRSRGRIRYSIAHEIAHTFFEDCTEKVRNRSPRDEQAGDEWQLEMLCNIAAAELLMPVGTFPDLRSKHFDIDDLMALRRQYDVSTEALLLRYIRLTSQPRALFSASRQESGDYAGHYKIDYAVFSSAWISAIPLGTHLDKETLLAQCTAIGYTAKGREEWAGAGLLKLECVGVPPYPNAVYPRVLGLADKQGVADEHAHSICYLKGSALDPRGEGPKILAHIVNDTSKTWGGGFAREVARRFPEAQIDFRQWRANNDGAINVLGQTHFCGQSDELQVASMVAQRGFGKSESPRISYPALESCLAKVRDAAAAVSASVHMPRIGCGQAGGNWDRISELIDTELVRRSIPVTVYDLPT